MNDRKLTVISRDPLSFAEECGTDSVTWIELPSDQRIRGKIYKNIDLKRQLLKLDVKSVGRVLQSLGLRKRARTFIRASHLNRILEGADPLAASADDNRKIEADTVEESDVKLPDMSGSEAAFIQLTATPEVQEARVAPSNRNEGPTSAESAARMLSEMSMSFEENLSNSSSASKKIPRSETEPQRAAASPAIQSYRNLVQANKDAIYMDSYSGPSHTAVPQSLPAAPLSSQPSHQVQRMMDVYEPKELARLIRVDNPEIF